jgi:hypothetical protein
VVDVAGGTNATHIQLIVISVISVFSDAPTGVLKYTPKREIIQYAQKEIRERYLAHVRAGVFSNY